MREGERTKPGMVTGRIFPLPGLCLKSDRRGSYGSSHSLISAMGPRMALSNG